MVRVSLCDLAATVATRSAAGNPIPAPDTARQHNPAGAGMYQARRVAYSWGCGALVGVLGYD